MKASLFIFLTIFILMICSCSIDSNCVSPTINEDFNKNFVLHIVPTEEYTPIPSWGVDICYYYCNEDSIEIWHRIRLQLGDEYQAQIPNTENKDVFCVSIRSIMYNGSMIFAKSWMTPGSDTINVVDRPIKQVCGYR